MAKPEWGVKRICHSCGTRYYDMLREPIVCPKCATQYDPDAFLRSRRARSAAAEETRSAPRRKPVPVAAVPEEAEDLEVADAADLEIEEEDGEIEVEEGEDLKEIEEEEFEEGDDAGEALMEDTSDLGEDDAELDDVIDIEGDEDEVR